jgi:magnesium transporter
VLPPRRRTDANNQINDVLSKLTALGTVLIPVRTLCFNVWGAQQD